MPPLAYTTSIMSWNLIQSAFRQIRASKDSPTPIDLNLETPSCIILCCTALEAFVNEISSLTSAFHFDEKKNNQSECPIAAQKETNTEMKWSNYRDISQIKECSKGSFYERYKRLLKVAGIIKPGNMQKLNHLCELRDAFVHFRACDVPIEEDDNGVIRCNQQPPAVFDHLKKYTIFERPIVANEVGEKWTLRVMTNTMAYWSIMLVLDSIIYVLSSLPIGDYRDFVLKRYTPYDESFSTLFEKKKADVECWIRDLVK